MNQQIEQLRAERMSLETRLLELDVEETENNRRYYCEGKPTSMQTRSTIAAERARLRLRLNAIGAEINRLRVAEMEGGGS